MKELLLSCALLLLSSCMSRSISDSGPSPDPAYVGEIHELNLLGTLRSESGAPAPTAPRGSRIVLVQSGSHYPDTALLEAFSADYEVLPLTGVPLNSAHTTTWGRGYGTANVHTPGLAPTGELLQAAAHSGQATTIVVVWGVLEGTQDVDVGKVASWLPIVGSFVPDEIQTLRIRLKAAVIDPDTGRWRLVLPDSLDDTATSSRYTRESSDQEQVQSLKTRAYPALARAVAGLSG